MNALQFARNASAILPLASLAACGQAQSLVGMPGAAARSAISANSSVGDLLYAAGYSDSQGPQVFMLSYPQGQLVGKISEEAQGMCSDSSGNVYLLDRNAAIEYAHGSTTPIKTLRIPGAELYNCAVDSSTNDLAVTFSCPPCDYEDLAIFPNGSGTPTRYSAPNAYGCTYDNQGNLFLSAGGGIAISELPSGSGTFRTIALSKDLGETGQVQWDGTYVTLETVQSPGSIYRIRVSGSTGTVVGKTKFGRYMRRIGYSWISAPDGTVVVTFSAHGNEIGSLGIWKYPRAKHAINIIKSIGSGNHGFGSVTVSVAPSHAGAADEALTKHILPTSPSRLPSGRGCGSGRTTSRDYSRRRRW
jgi:hypothetical protein